MSSKKLSVAPELAPYQAHQAYIRLFKYKPLQQFDYLLCIHGDRGQNTRGEVAHLKICEAAYQAIAARFPVAELEANLFRSEFFVVAEVALGLAQAPLAEWLADFLFIVERNCQTLPALFLARIFERGCMSWYAVVLRFTTTARRSGWQARLS